MRKPASARSAVVLIAVLMVVFLLTLAAYQYNEMVTSELRAADSSANSVQARALAYSGIYYTAAILGDPNSFQGLLNSNPWDSPSAFQGVLVYTDPKTGRTGRFTIFSPSDPAENNPQAFRYGLIDEASKINPNAVLQIDPTGTVLYNMLMSFAVTDPNMTADIADSIIDWIDSDDDPRPNGAESSYYQGLSPPYRAKNAPLESVEELLLVKGVTPQFLFGTDLNRNWIQDSGEDSGTGWNPGWAAYLTVYSREQNIDNTGNPRLYLNDTISQTSYSSLSSTLSQALANFIVLYRTQNGGSTTGGSTTTTTTATMTTLPGGNTVVIQSMTTGGATGRTATSQEISDKVNEVLSGSSQNAMQSKSLASRYDLVNAYVSWTVGTGRDQQTVRMDSPLNDKSQLSQYLPILLDKTTTQKSKELPARINVNTAPQMVLAALPGLTDTDVQSILEQRPDTSSMDPTDTTYQTPAWLYTQANISITKLKALERYITARTQVYRVQVLGYFDQGGPAVRMEAVIDTNNGYPRIVMVRDLTELGRGLPQSQ
ncbi:MAG TPA: type II secretion system protein GspK [Gemmataceae bacterium]|nr:type II secretion system protein GspK [Gemmataceae bacterium]